MAKKHSTISSTTSTTPTDAPAKANVYSIITDRIIASLAQGVAPWRKPWKVSGIEGLPKNLVSKKPYRGINTWLLMSAGYSSPYFLTFKQARELGGCVRKGERGFPVVFWSFDEADKEKAETGELERHNRAWCKYYTVFNVEQCDGLRNVPVSPVSPAPESFDPIPVCDSIVASWAVKPTINHGGDRACYSPELDIIRIPRPSAFTSAPEYYSTLFHELTHSTGHKTRLSRSTLGDIARHGDSNYSREELVAEMGAAFLCGFSGIENATIDNSAAYIASWLKALKADSKMAIIAAGQAQKAVDMILGDALTMAGDDASPVVPAPVVSSPKPRKPSTPKVAKVRTPVPSPAIHAPVPVPSPCGVEPSAILSALKQSAPFVSVRVVGERPILIKRQVLSLALASMEVRSISISREDTGQRFGMVRSLVIGGVDGKNQAIKRRYSFKDQNLVAVRKSLIAWAGAKRRAKAKGLKVQALRHKAPSVTFNLPVIVPPVPAPVVSSPVKVAKVAKVRKPVTRKPRKVAPVAVSPVAVSPVAAPVEPIPTPIPALVSGANVPTISLPPASDKPRVGFFRRILGAMGVAACQ